MVCGLLLVAATGTRATASPTPGPGQPTPTASPTGSGGPGGDANCAAPNQVRQVRWCFAWVIRTDTPPRGAPSHWLTVCSRATTDDEANACDAASLTLDSPPPDNTPSVLLDGPADNTDASLVDCDQFTRRAAGDHVHAGAWNAKAQRCRQFGAYYLSKLDDPDPPTPCARTDVACQVQKGVSKALGAGIRMGIQGVVDLAVQGMTYLLSWLAKMVFTATSIGAPDNTFFLVYNTSAGILLLLVFVFFLISVIVNGLRVHGPGPVATLGGLVRAILGITLAGGIAWVVTQAWDEATDALIDRNIGTPWDPSRMVTAITDLSAGVGTGFVALVIALLSILGLILLFIMMLFRGLLATGAALFGAMAMSGQVIAEGRVWGRRWLWTVNALASSKFFIVMLWIYGSRAAYESNELITSLRAMLMIWLMVLTPAVLLRLTSIWDGYLSDVNAAGVWTAASRGVGDAVGDLDESGQGGGPGGAAAEAMNANAGGIPTTPTGAAAPAAGLRDGPSRQAADAVSTGADGEKFGDPGLAGGGGEPDDDRDTDAAGADQSHHPNGAEADGIDAGATGARHDLASGELTPPGDTTGVSGSLPATPHAAGVDVGNPVGAMTGTGSGAAQQTGAAAGGDSGAGISGPGQAPTASTGGAAGAADVPIVPV
ncbi:hypothetical protein Raf01_71360 [Rugosimonospora africana]|uniref:TrbL/VirB6 plasmid conjugal transfer protein n=1 Tax=Rugosimonospora africana TaxID=556532 RepID=A0A8J3QXG5_9ACTN|nr:hypothetical protein Raf01_71360 [Rugosimonospora africana]